MADTLRMMPAKPGTFAIAAAGSFGERVISLLTAAFPGSTEFKATGAEISAAFAGQESAVVIALWRPDPELCDAADALSYEHRRPWLPVIMEHPVIRIGPLLRPPAGPCFRCYTRRRRQHDQQPWATAALLAAYDRDQFCGPGGYLPHHARLAAAIAQAMLSRPGEEEALGNGSPGGGDVTTIGLSDMGLSVGMRSSRVIPCHDCDRCGTAGPPGDLGWLTEVALSTRAQAADPGWDESQPDSLPAEVSGAVR
jgi:bacteriocin biosynthesis cyclodehydratase domain-containing protein